MNHCKSSWTLRLAGLVWFGCGAGHAAEQDWFGLLNQAKQQELKGEYKAASLTLREALRIAGQSRLGPRALAPTLNNAGSVAQGLGQYVEAEKYYRQSIANWEASGDFGVNLSCPLHNLATLYAGTGRYRLAERMHQRVLEIRTRALGTRHPDVARVLISYGLVLHFQGDLEKAERSYREAQEILRDVKTAAGVDLATLQTNLASLLVTRGSCHEAANLAAEGVASLEKSLGKEHPALVPALTWQGIAAMKLGAYAEAADLLQRAVSLAKRSLGEEHPRLAFALMAQAELLHSQNRKGEARRLQQQAKTIIASHQRENLLGHTVDFHSLLAAGEK